MEQVMAGELAAARATEDPTAPVKPDARTMWAEALRSATRGLNYIGSAWIFVLMCLMLADLGGRFVFNRPIDGVAEVAGLSIVGIVYLQLGAAVNSGRMIRADFIADWIGRKAPGLGYLLSGLFQGLGALTMVGLAYVSWGPMVSAWNEKETLGTAGVFLVSTWPFRGIVFLGTTLAALSYLTLAANEFSRLFLKRGTQS